MNTDPHSPYSQKLEAYMKESLLRLKKEGASEEKIKKTEREFLSLIKARKTYEKEEEKQIRSFLKVLKKDTCKITEKKLRDIFFLPIGTAKTVSVPWINMRASKAIKSLEEANLEKMYTKSKTQKRQEKSLQKLRKALIDVAKLMKDPNVWEFYELHASQNHEVSRQTVINELIQFDRMTKRRILELNICLEKRKSTGRPSLQAFYDFVYDIAKIYEDLSGLHFKVDKQKGSIGDDAGKYLAVTEGHQFVCEAVKWLHKEFSDPALTIYPEYIKPEYSDKNIFNACEYARKKLRESRSDKRETKSR